MIEEIHWGVLGAWLDISVPYWHCLGQQTVRLCGENYKCSKISATLRAVSESNSTL
jgi:hypothetical protein